MFTAGIPPAVIARGFAAAAEAPRFGLGNDDFARCLGAWFWSDDRPSAKALSLGFDLPEDGIRHRCNRLKLSFGVRQRGDDLEGEEWAQVPGTAYWASNLGRIKSPRWRILSPWVQNGRPRISHPGNFMVGSAVLAAFRATDLRLPTLHRNGDLTDCRLANLRPGRLQPRSHLTGGDQAWTESQHRILRKATSIADAARRTGHSYHHTRREMGRQGITKPSRFGKKRLQLADRSIDLVQSAVADLLAAGLTDRDVNLGLGITSGSRERDPEVRAAIVRCVEALERSGRSASEVQTVMGWISDATLLKYRRLAGLTQVLIREEPQGLEDEEWQEIPGRLGLVSNLGRVIGPTGRILRPFASHPSSRQAVRFARPGGGTDDVKVSELVRAAFRPEIPRDRIAFSNGNKTDARAANLTIRRTSDEARVDLRKAAGQAVQWWVPPALRQDLISDMVVIWTEGRALRMGDAFKVAVRDHNRRTGGELDKKWGFKRQGLDAPIGDSDATLMDRLTSDGEIMRSARKSVNRPD